MKHIGFTLIELLATLAILGVLAFLALPLAENTVRRAKETELRSSLRELRSAIDRYKEAVDQGLIEREAGSSGYPPNLQVLVDGVDDAHSLDRRKMYFLRRIPRDPLNSGWTIAAEDSWGKRSYASDPESPQEGDDVYDVYSRATGVGLNGIPYREW